jgi:hypothetical protein
MADWEQQAADMASIYENAYLTIAATASANSDEGCFRHSEPTYRAHGFHFLSNAGQDYEIFARRKPSHCTDWNVSRERDHESEWPLLTRAWTYQERLLSPRILHFAQAELWWECMEHSKCECSPDASQRPDGLMFGDPPKVAHGRALQRRDQGELLKRWRDMVEEYSRLELKFETDRLYGIQGLANRIGHSSGVINTQVSTRAGETVRSISEEAYIDGVWVQNLWRDLCWFTLDPEPSRRSDTVPTWSWASTKNIANDEKEDGVSCITLVDTGLVKLGDESTASTKRYLKIVAPMAEAKLQYRTRDSVDGSEEDPEKRMTWAVLHFLTADPPRQVGWSPSTRSDYQIHRSGNDHIPDGTIIHCMQICSTERNETVKDRRRYSEWYEYDALMLLPYQKPTAAPSFAKYYKRIGYLEYRPMTGEERKGGWKDIWNQPKEEVYLL